MRLLFIIDSLGSGGAQRQMVNLAVGLKRRGHTIAFFLYYPQYGFFAAHLHQHDIPIHRCNKTRRFSTGPIISLRRTISKGNWDGGLAFLPTPSFYAEIARLGVRSFALVVSERSRYRGEDLPMGRFLLEQTHRLADHITVNSHHQRLRMEQSFPWMRGKLSTIYNGVDLAQFTPSGPPPHGKEPSLRLLALGSVAPVKNAVTLVRALAQYRKSYGRRCTVRWAGKVTPDGPSQAEFREADRLLRELFLESHWEWLGEREDVNFLLRECDALIHPSFLEGLPNAICEALASGRPVLASDVCDNGRLVREGVTGFLFDPSDPGDIARTIHQLDQLSEEKRLDMAREGRTFASQELSLDVCSERYEELFASLIR